MDHAHTNDNKPEPNNLLICCDGTGNEISENISNVLKFALPSQDRQDAAAADGALRSRVGSAIPGAARWRHR